jgi:hypothetical protein
VCTQAASLKLKTDKDKEINSQAEIIAEFNKKAKIMQVRSWLY